MVLVYFGRRCNLAHSPLVRFSVDTAPVDTLVYAGQGASLLIHEATMADDRLELAEKKAHSTVSQAYRCL